MSIDPSTGPRSAAAGARPSLVVGLSGGIASGKSRVARLLAGPDGVVIDADALAHEALDSDEVRARVREHFGPELFGSDGAVDRAALGARVFDAPAERELLEGWIHPRVRVSIARHLKESRERSVPRIVLDVPLLFENDDQHHLTRECDVLVFVDAPLGAREARVIRDRGWQPGELARREACQTPLDQKRERSDHVVQNDGTPEQLEAAVRRLDRVLEGHGDAP